MNALADEAATRVGQEEPLLLPVALATETVAERMRGRSVDVFVHHISVSLEERKAAEDRFSVTECREEPYGRVQ